LKEQAESKQATEEQSSVSKPAEEQAQTETPQGKQAEKPQEEQAEAPQEEPQTESDSTAPVSKKSPRNEEGDPEDAPPVKKQHVDE
jgi:hypothetical protein